VGMGVERFLCARTTRVKSFFPALKRCVQTAEEVTRQNKTAKREKREKRTGKENRKYKWEMCGSKNKINAGEGIPRYSPLLPFTLAVASRNGNIFFFLTSP
jgi:hypothetical protein